MHIVACHRRRFAQGLEYLATVLGTSMKERLVKLVAGNRSLSHQVRFKNLMPLHLFQASSSLVLQITKNQVREGS